MKLYRVKEGTIIETGPRTYSFETDWDELINRPDLHNYLRNLLESNALLLLMVISASGFCRRL